MIQFVTAWVVLACQGVVPVSTPAPGEADRKPAAMALDEFIQRRRVLTQVEIPTGRYTIKTERMSAVIAPGLPMVVVNGMVRPLPTAPSIVDGRLILPAEVVALFDSPLHDPAIARPAVSRVRPGPRGASKDFRIVIDPGHGGVHTGGKSQDGSLMEKDVVLDVSRRLQQLLEGYGVDVVLTRTRDTQFSTDVREDLERRVEIANRAQPDLFLSIHSNYHPTSEPRGFEVYVPRHAGAGRGTARSLAEAIVGEFRANLDTEDRGLKEAGFYVLKHSDAPAVLVELEFISNPRGERELGSATHRQKLAGLLFESVKKFMSKR